MVTRKALLAKHAAPARNKIPPDQIERLKALWAQGDTNRTAARKTGICRRAVDDRKLNLTLFGEAYTRWVPPGPRPLLTYEQEEFVMAFIKDKPTALRSEIVWLIYDEFELACSESFVSKLIKKHKFSRKKAACKALEASDELRDNWKELQGAMPLRRICCVDENASNKRTSWRKYGYSPVNTPCQDQGGSKRSKRWSILPAITYRGYLANPLIYQGSIKAQDYEDWLEFFVVKQLARGTFLVMDNALIHHGPRFQQLCEDNGIILRYLPTYSPDFNPIDLSFNTLKAWIRKNVCEADAFNTFGHFLQHAIASIDTQEHAPVWFWSCRYRTWRKTARE